MTLLSPLAQGEKDDDEQERELMGGGGQALSVKKAKKNKEKGKFGLDSTKGEKERDLLQSLSLLFASSLISSSARRSPKWEAKNFFSLLLRSIIPRDTASSDLDL